MCDLAKTRIQVRGLIATALLPTAVAVAEPEPTKQLIVALRENDRTAIGAFTMTVRVEYPLTYGGFLPRGTAANQCTLTQGENTFAMACDVERLPPLRFHALEEAGFREHDFDQQGNLLIWITMSGLCFSDAKMNDEWQQLSLFRVTPGGQVVEGATEVNVSRHPAGSRNGLAMADARRYLWALGRGWSGGESGLPELVEGDVEAGIVSLRGSLRSLGQETWSIEISAADGFLVRNARLTSNGIEEMKVITKGVRWFGNVSLAEAGQVQIPLGREAELEWKVHLIDYRPVTESNLLERARQTIESAIGGDGVVIDRRRDTQNPIIHRRGLEPPKE